MSPIAMMSAHVDDAARTLDGTLTFNVPGVDTSMNLAIPKGSTVTSATLTVKGITVGVPEVVTKYDYMNQGSSVAYYGTTTDDPVSKVPTTYQKTLCNLKEYPLIKSSDDQYLDTPILGSSFQQLSAYHHFSVKVGSEEASKVYVNWEGQGTTMTNQGRTQTGAKVHIYNNNNNSWVKVGGYSKQSGDQTISKSFDVNAKDYVDSNDTVHVIAQNDRGLSGDIMTDYVYINISTGGESYPVGPGLDVGDDGDLEWQFDGEFTGSESVDFKDELQEHVDAGGFGPGDVNVVLAFNSSAPGALEIHDLIVEYDEPVAPVWNDITGLGLSEDDPAGEGDDLVDLLNFVTDDKDLANISFEITYEEDSSKVDATLDMDGHHVDFSVADNWWGTVGFKATATDIDTLSTESSEFEVTVNPVNDPPEIDPINSQVGVAGTPMTFTMTASDIDTDLDVNETLTFTDNSDMFEIDPVTGVVAFTPLKEDVGQNTATLFVTDAAGASDHTVVGLTINSYNGDNDHDPLFDPIGDQTAYEDTLFSLELSASDEDAIYGDRLTFSDDSDLFDINKDSGKLSFTPTQEDVGVYDVTFTVTDIGGGSASNTVTLTVLNVNDPPVIIALMDTSINEGDTFETTAEADDIDLVYNDSEKLTFSDDSELFDIDPVTGKISYSAGGQDAGSYMIKITVTDTSGATDSTNFTLTVVDINLPPEIEDPLPADNRTVLEGETITVTTTDPDGDPVNVTWKDEDGKVLAQGPNLDSKVLGPGTHKVIIEAFDGENTSTETFEIDVTKNPKLHKNKGSETGIPGFEGYVLVAVMMLATLLVLRRRA